MTQAFTESERAILGALMTGTKETQEWLSSELQVSDFYDGAHQRLYKSIQGILDEGLEVNPLSARERSRVSQGAIAACLDASSGFAPSALKTCVADVRGAAQSRQLQAAFSEALAECGAGKKPDAVMESLESKLYGRLSGGIGNAASDSEDVARQVVTSVIERVDNKGKVEISTGLKLLDKAIIGLRPKLYVVAARPAIGKSALAQSISDAVLEQSPPEPWEAYGVLTFSAEMPKEELMERHIAAKTGVNVRKIQSGSGFDDGELAAVVDAANHFKRGTWRIIDQAMGIAQVRRIARLERAKMARKGIKLALVVLDYTQLFADGENREQAVSAVSRGSKLMSRDLDCAVIALSQLNRGLEHREDKRPLLSDLRESGAIEQDADCVIFVYRGHVYDPNVPPEEAELIIGKQRGGPIGSFPVHFNPRLTKFTDKHVNSSERAEPIRLPGIPGGEKVGVQAKGTYTEDMRLFPSVQGNV